MLQNEVKQKDKEREEIARKIKEFGEENITKLDINDRAEDTPAFRLGGKGDE